MLARQIERIRLSREIDSLVVATSDQSSDDPIARLCDSETIPCFRGSLDDVLGRFYHASAAYNPGRVVRLTGDCPLSDPDVIDAAIRKCRPELFDYVTNALGGGFPHGLDVEVFNFACLAEAYREARLPSQREHVTPFINRQPERYRIGILTHPIDLSALRWTVDYPDDFELVSRIYEALYPQNPGFRLNDVLGLLERNPEWKTLNTSHSRNEGYTKSLERDRIHAELQS